MTQAQASPGPLAIPNIRVIRVLVMTQAMMIVTLNHWHVVRAGGSRSRVLPKVEKFKLHRRLEFQPCIAAVDALHLNPIATQ